MPRLDARVARIEAGATAGLRQPLIVFAEPGESTADCLRRSGYDPDDPELQRRLVIVVQWMTPHDQREGSALMAPAGYR